MLVSTNHLSSNPGLSCNPIVSFYCTAQQTLTKHKGKYIIMQGSEKRLIKFKLVLWASSSRISLAQGILLSRLR